MAAFQFIFNRKNRESRVETTVMSFWLKEISGEKGSVRPCFVMFHAALFSKFAQNLMLFLCWIHREVAVAVPSAVSAEHSFTRFCVTIEIIA
jgi:hypothetical protein